MLRLDSVAACCTAHHNGSAHLAARLATAVLRPSPSPSVPAKSLTYVAIGASDTVGVGANNPQTEGWVPRLATKLGPGTRVRNLGVSGTVLSTALAEQAPVAVREQPDLVTVWLAVNDMNARVPLETYAADLERLLTMLQRTGATILIANVPDLRLVPTYRDQDSTALRAEVQRWNVAIAAAAQRHNANVVDLFAHYKELAARPELVSGDGFHPSSAGYARVADLFYDAARAAGL
jgi:lysophospholipase L1-like esterase